MIPLAALPTVNAVLNATSAVLLFLGYAAIRRRAVRLHRACMLGAFVASTVFLVSYVTYHVQAGTTRFPGEGWVRAVYFSILGTHTLLAACIPPLALTTLGLALRGRFERHARLARWTLPTWLYVSVTGVVIYVLLYHPPFGIYAVVRRASAVVPASMASAKPPSTASESPRPGSPAAGATSPR